MDCPSPDKIACHNCIKTFNDTDSEIIKHKPNHPCCPARVDRIELLKKYLCLSNSNAKTSIKKQQTNKPMQPIHALLPSIALLTRSCRRRILSPVHYPRVIRATCMWVGDRLTKQKCTLIDESYKQSYLYNQRTYSCRLPSIIYILLKRACRKNNSLTYTLPRATQVKNN